MRSIATTQDRWFARLKDGTEIEVKHAERRPVAVFIHVDGDGSRCGLVHDTEADRDGCPCDEGAISRLGPSEYAKAKAAKIAEEKKAAEAEAARVAQAKTAAAKITETATT